MPKYKIVRTDNTSIVIEADYVYAQMNGQLDVVNKTVSPNGYADRSHVAIFAPGQGIEVVEVQDGS